MQETGTPPMQRAGQELDRSYQAVIDARRERAAARRRGFGRLRGPSDDIRDIVPRPYDPDPDGGPDAMRAQLTDIAEHELAPMLRALGSRMDTAARAIGARDLLPAHWPSTRLMPPTHDKGPERPPYQDIDPRLFVRRYLQMSVQDGVTRGERFEVYWNGAQVAALTDRHDLTRGGTQLGIEQLDPRALEQWRAALLTVIDRAPASRRDPDTPAPARDAYDVARSIDSPARMSVAHPDVRSALEQFERPVRTPDQGELAREVERLRAARGGHEARPDQGIARE